MQHFWYTSIASINFCLKYLTMTVEKDLMKRFFFFKLLLFLFCFVFIFPMVYT